MAQKTFTLFLSKSEVVGFEQLLTDSAAERLAELTTQIHENAEFADGATLYVFSGFPTVPLWLRHLRETFPVGGRIENKSSCGLLFFRKSERIFVATFAHGWMCLNDDYLEGDFGLRVAVNALDEKKLKRLERANLGDALKGLSLSPFQREFGSFGLDDALDLVRRLGGAAKEEVSANAVNGSQSLKVTGDYTVADLPEIADEALELYASEAYRRTGFSVIDLVSPVPDPALARRLDGLAANRIREGMPEFELGLPLSYDDDEVAFRFVGPGVRGRYPDLLLRNYISVMRGRLDDITSQTLREHKIAAIFDDDTRPETKWSIHKALVGSIIHEGGLYAINEGYWYRLDDAFTRSVERTFQVSIAEWDERPRPLRKIYDEAGNGSYQSEESYNEELANAFGLVLLDRQLVRLPGVQRHDFEVCDLLDIEAKKLIHVKKSSRRSSVLSHFFKQGSNSAQQLVLLPETMVQVIDIVREVAGENAAQRLIEANADIERKWTVEFIIADTPRADGEFNIPIFSKITFRDEVSRLMAMGYLVRLKFISLEPEAV